MNSNYTAIEKALLEAIETQVVGVMDSLEAVASAADSTPSAGTDYFSSCAAVFSKVLYVCVARACDLRAQAMGQRLEKTPNPDAAEAMERINRALQAFTDVVTETEFVKR